jgi:ATP-dependent DNA helicase RecQ
MENSAQQARNVDGAFVLEPDPLPRSPVLLVDDIVDSGWTFAVAAWLLRSGGSGEVFPLALAEAAADNEA